MKQFFFMNAMALLLLCPSALFAKVWSHPNVIYKTHSSIEVKEVMFSPNETSVTLQCIGEPLAKIYISRSTYACDEQGNRYPILRAEGIQLDSLMQFSEKKISFTLHFKPLPDSTHAFDLIEGRQIQHLRIYGIHDRNKSLQLKTIEGDISAMETDSLWFRRDSTVINCYIYDYNANSMPHEMTVHYNCEQFHMDNGIAKANTAVLKPDGTASCTFLMDRPAWNNLSFGSRYYYYYVRPGDTLNIEIHHFGQWDEQVTYYNTQGRACYPALVTEAEVLYGDGLIKHYMPIELFQKRLKVYGETAKRLHAYLSEKYHLSPWEIHLLTTQQKLQLAYIQALYMNKWKTEQEAHGSPIEIPINDLNWLSQLQWDDMTIPILKSWNGTTIFHFLLTGFSIQSNCAIIQQDLGEKIVIWKKPYHTLSPLSTPPVRGTYIRNGKKVVR